MGPAETRPFPYCCLQEGLRHQQAHSTPPGEHRGEALLEIARLKDDLASFHTQLTVPHRMRVQGVRDQQRLHIGEEKERKHKRDDSYDPFGEPSSGSASILLKSRSFRAIASRNCTSRSVCNCVCHSQWLDRLTLEQRTAAACRRSLVRG